MPHGERADRDLARSYARLDKPDLARLGRAAQAELEAFFARNPRLASWRDRVRISALAQGGAEYYLRGRREIRDLDVIVCWCIGVMRKRSKISMPESGVEMSDSKISKSGQESRSGRASRTDKAA